MLFIGILAFFISRVILVHYSCWDKYAMYTILQSQIFQGIIVLGLWSLMNTIYCGMHGYDYASTMHFIVLFTTHRQKSVSLPGALAHNDCTMFFQCCFDVDPALIQQPYWSILDLALRQHPPSEWDTFTLSFFVQSWCIIAYDGPTLHQHGGNVSRDGWLHSGRVVVSLLTNTRRWVGVGLMLGQRLLNPLTAKLFYLNFHPLDVVSR